MAAPILPSDTAPDMVTFALSGPGLAAGGMFLGLCLAYIGMYVEFGPRRNGNNTIAYILRISTDQMLTYYDGQRQLRRGESVLSFPDMRAAYAVCTELENAARKSGVDLRVWLSTMGGGGVKSERVLVPRELNAAGGLWRERAVAEGVSDAEKVRFEYDAIDSDDSIDKEWASVMRDLPRLQIVRSGEGMCKLCGGTGTRRCARCGGVTGTRTDGTFKCHCENGRVPCDFCGGSGLPS